MSVIRVSLFALLAGLIAVSASPVFADNVAADADDDDDDDDDDDEEGDDDDDEEEGDDDDDDDEEEGDDDDDDEEKTASFTETSTGPFPGEGRFFFERPLTDAERKKTKVSGSLTSSTMLFREFGVLLPEPDPATMREGQGTAQRLFTDLRAQLGAKGMGSGTYDLRLDVRGRFVPGTCKVDDLELGASNPCQRLQSGSFSGNELDLRELHLTRRGEKLDLLIGRQLVLDIAAHRLDGVQGRLRRSRKLTLLGFAGLHPQKGSRDIRQDYPRSAVQTDGSSKRLLPITAGGGVAYRLQKLYGSAGLVGVVPLAEAPEEVGEPGQQETPRIFLSANGYYRQGPSLDIFHYAVLDVLGSAAFSLTNATVGFNVRPTTQFRINAQLSRVDTETLTALAQTKLEAPDAEGTGAIQNNVEVLRIAADSARLSLSGDFGQRRFRLSTIFALRRRPEVTLTSPDGGSTVVLGAAQDVEAMIRFVDRRSYKGFRIGGHVARSFALGSDRFQRASTLSILANASKVLLGGKAEVDGNVGFVQSSSVPSGDGMGACGVMASNDSFESCFAGTSARTISLGATGFYRLGAKLMAVGSANFGLLNLSSDNIDATRNQGQIMPVSLFLRLAYRL